MNTEQTNQLETIVNTINQNIIEIESVNLLARNTYRKGLELAFATGSLLIQCKIHLRETKSGIGWEVWFGQNIKGFDIRTGQIYMKLYQKKTNHASFFDNCESIRDAIKKLNDSKYGIGDNKQTVTTTTVPVVEITETECESPYIGRVYENGRFVGTVETPKTSPVVEPIESAFFITPEKVVPVQTETPEEKEIREVKLKLRKAIKNRVTSLEKLFRNNRVNDIETIDLLSPLVQIWNERPISSAITLDGGRVEAETEAVTTE
jgi:hypothetical protein